MATTNGLDWGSIINGGLSLYDYFNSNNTASNVADNLKAGYQQGADTITGLLAPYLQSGDYGTAGYKNLLENPSTITSNPGYEFQRLQGQQALERSAAAKSGLLGGGTAIDLLKYGQDYASTSYDQALSRYVPLMQMGYGAATNAAQPLSDLYSSMGEASALRELMQGQNTKDAIQNIQNGLSSGDIQGVLDTVKKLGSGAYSILAATGLDKAIESATGVDIGSFLGQGPTGTAAGTSLVSSGTEGLDAIAGNGYSGYTYNPQTGQLQIPISGGTEGTASTSLLDTVKNSYAQNGVVGTLANAYLGGKATEAWNKSGAQNSTGEALGTVAGIAGSLVPLMGPVTGAAAAFLGGTLGNLLGGVYGSVTGTSDSDWSMRFSTDGSGLSKNGQFKTALGTFGFSADQTRNFGEADKAEVVSRVKDTLTQIDAGIASALTSSELSALKSKLNGMEIGQGSNATAATYGRDPVAGYTKQRLEALKSTLSPARLQSSGLQQVIDSWNKQFPEMDSAQMDTARQTLSMYANGGNNAAQMAGLEMQYPGITAKVAEAMSTVDTADMQPGWQLGVVNSVLGDYNDSAKLYRV